MTREELLKELNESAIEKARLEKKFRQGLLLLVAWFVIILIGHILIVWKIIPSYNGASSAALFIGCILTIIIGGVFLPFGKDSEEKVYQHFQKILKKTLEDNRKELKNIEKREIELKEEILILKKIRFDKIDYES